MLMEIGSASAFAAFANSPPLIEHIKLKAPSHFQLFSNPTENTNDGEKKDTSTKITSGGHDVRNTSVKEVKISDEEMAVQKRFATHQQNVKKLGFPIDVRTLVEYNHGFAVLCTNSKSNEGYPNGSVIAFAPDAEGRPIFLFSNISPHTVNLKKDERTSLVVASKEFKGPSDGRVTLTGKTSRVPPEEAEAAKELYLKKHPDAFWAEFGDFKWYRMDVEYVNFVGGFARAGAVSAQDYREAKPDLISKFGMQIASHMNEDHMSSTIAMVEQAIPGLGVSEALITSVDSLGMQIKVARTPKAGDQPQQFKLRLPFPRQVVERKDVKDVIVQMTREAATAAATQEDGVVSVKE